jgi:hypothetical protein
MKSIVSNKYRAIDFDIDRDSRVAYLARNQIPWKFINLLPYKINVYVIQYKNLELVATIDANSTFETLKTMSGAPLKKGDAIHVLLPTNKLNPRSTTSNQFKILRPTYLFDDSREIRIGDIVYEDRVAFAPGIDIHHDIIGLRIHNHITMPVNVFYKGENIAKIAGDDGTNFMAGSPNSVYLNNERFGFMIGDELSFVFVHDGKKYASVKIIDNYTSDIILGEITQHFVGAIQDMFSYRVNEPNINGLRYYDTVTAYTSLGRTAGIYTPYNGTKAYHKVTAVAEGVKL